MPQFRYGGGTSELRLGRLTSSTLNTDSTADDDTGSPILMTKFLPTPWRFTKGHFEAALRASLARLKIDCCPVYLLHTPVRETESESELELIFQHQSYHRMLKALWFIHSLIVHLIDIRSFVDR